MKIKKILVKNKSHKKSNESAVSPIIASLVLIMVAVVLAGLLFNWTSFFATTQTGLASEETRTLIKIGQINPEINVIKILSQLKYKNSKHH